MLNNQNTNVERIIAKIDNDFNPDNSDWIPRVAAWAIDAMSQLKVLSTEKKKRTLKVTDGIAYSPCAIKAQGLVVYDKQGCVIPIMTKSTGCSCCSSTGEQDCGVRAGTTSIENNPNPAYGPNVMAMYKQSKDFSDRYNVKEIVDNPKSNHNYVLIDDNKIELNFDTDEIVIESEEVRTYYSDYYRCDLPVIPNNGLLIEAIGLYCMYKMLTRGMKHPVLTLTANNPGINPYLGWQELKSKAKASVAIDGQGNYNGGAWRAMFYNFTFARDK